MHIGPMSPSPAAPLPGPRPAAAALRDAPATHDSPAPLASVVPRPAPSPGSGDPGAPGGVRIRVGLATVMGLEDRPGTIAGRVPVPSEVARGLIAAQHRGTVWRFAVTDAAGRLVLAGPIRRRPGSEAPPATRRRGGLVEIHVPVALLEELVAAPARCGAWSGVVADIAAQYARRDQVAACLDRHPSARFAHRAGAARDPVAGQLERTGPAGPRYRVSAPGGPAPAGPAPRRPWPPGHPTAGGGRRNTG